MRTLVLSIAFLSLAAVASGQELPRASDLPDWSGAWVRSTGGFFESAPEQALEPSPSTRLASPGAALYPEIPGYLRGEPKADRRLPLPRSHLYLRHSLRVPADVPAAGCLRVRRSDRNRRGCFLRMARTPFASTPTGAPIRRRKTCGTPTPGITSGTGRATRSCSTQRGLKGVGSTVLGRSGAVMSDQLEVMGRIRLIETDRLLVTLTLVDSEALTRSLACRLYLHPPATRQYRIRLRLR